MSSLLFLVLFRNAFSLIPAIFGIKPPVLVWLVVNESQVRIVPFCVAVCGVS